MGLCFGGIKHSYSMCQSIVIELLFLVITSLYLKFKKKIEDPGTTEFKKDKSKLLFYSHLGIVRLLVHDQCS